ncbi:glycosyl transferase, group 2 family protein [Gloeomargarita lithophora Alchichica-D10]|uniref:Glycosyl transferase, group 2 family protein n=1 Tax=Gloeomargarita lithophora Alchichica-D10 TaxID=1188229 RepID=A0A1J0ADV8_9CYAN|nr:glycosyltransferase [Gloeomargarita lithophora]APB34126.1 glycosyl transferase, group 2 family protein [Gloeomargarita lithophora Alchichica-D10]
MPPFDPVLLVQVGVLSPAQFAEAQAWQNQKGCPFPEALKELGMITESRYITVRSQITQEQLLRDWLTSKNHHLDLGLAGVRPPHYWSQAELFPCAWQDQQTLVVAVTEQSHNHVAQIINQIWPGMRVVPLLATATEITRLIVQLNLGKQLVISGAITTQQWQDILEIYRRTGSPIGQILTRLDYIKPQKLVQILVDLTGCPSYSNLIGTPVWSMDADLVRRFDPRVMASQLFIPLNQLDEHTILIMVQDPLDMRVDAQIHKQFPGIEITKVLGTESDITYLLDSEFQQLFSWQAVYRLAARSPRESAAQVFTPAQILFGYVLLVMVFWGLLNHTSFTLSVVMSLVNLFYVSAIGFKLLLSLVGAVARKHYVDPADVARLTDDELPVYTILVPVYNEPEIVSMLIKGLGQLDYPHEKLDVLLLLEEKDRVTIEAAKAAHPPQYIRFIYIPDSKPKTKPKACNYGLAFAQGQYLTIYDAEDIPDPDQLKKALLAFRHGPANLVCVQAALNYFNRDENFLTRMFTLEYSYWFDYLLPGLETLQLPIPLGGTSNHFRTDRLLELGGWDPFNVTEDADLGIRASQRGYTVGVIDSTTYEEANCRPKNWIRQRSRWIKGYMQTWLVHNRDPWKSLTTLGLGNWLAYQFFVGGTIVCFLSNPILWLFFIYAAISRAPWLEQLFPGWMLYISLFNLILGNSIGIYLNMIAVFRRKYYNLTLYALLNPAYWLLHSAGSYMALWQLFTKPFYWEKTIHGLSKVGHGATPLGKPPQPQGN